MKRRDLAGERFGKLTVQYDVSTKQNRTWWMCKCDCGIYTKVSNSMLLSGKKKSCGCISRPYYMAHRGRALFVRRNRQDATLPPSAMEELGLEEL